MAHGKKVRALVRNREKAVDWANQGVDLVDGDWSDPAAIERALKRVEGAFVMLPSVWAPSPDYKEARGVIANYVEALIKGAPPRVAALSSMGANRTSGLGMITALSLLEQGFRDLISPAAFVREGRAGWNATGLLYQAALKVTHVADARTNRAVGEKVVDGRDKRGHDDGGGQPRRSHGGSQSCFEGKG